MKLTRNLTLIRERSKVDSIAFQFCASMIVYLASYPALRHILTLPINEK